MIKISKELLSEVLDYDVDKYTIVSSTEITQIRIWKKDAEMWDYRSYDIYHLAHKCKEWALSKGYDLVCKIKYKLSKAYYYECNIEQLYEANLIFYYENEETSENSEVEAIFKACEYILKEIKK